MVGKRSAGTSLFELLARAWSFDEEVVQTDFNQANTTVYFRLRSGALALASTKDLESPKSRTRIETDTGRTTIRQRKNPIPEARTLPVVSDTRLPVVRLGEQGFLVIDVDGVPWQVTAQGQCLDKSTSIAVSGISSLCSTGNGATLAVAAQRSICIYKADSMEVLNRVDTDHPVSCMAFSANGERLAAWGEGSLSLIDVQNPANEVRHIDGINEGDVKQISWNHAGRYLSCSSGTRAFWIVDAGSATVQKIEGYPGQVDTATFSEPGKALVTSGAYRLAGWSIEDLPANDQPGTPLSSGKPGLVIVSCVAAHPARSLVAVGYPDGLITITGIGTSEEMMVHKEMGTGISDLSWSQTGEHLSIGFKSGKAAIVSFPDKLFK